MFEMEVALGAFIFVWGRYRYRKGGPLRIAQGICLMILGLGGAILWFAEFRGVS